MNRSAYSLTVYSTLSAIAAAFSAVPVGNQIADSGRLSIRQPFAIANPQIGLFGAG